jgi:hypothetical protein
MSEVRLNIIDAGNAVHGTAHGFAADAVIAALNAEPETIGELEAAIDRYIKRLDDRRPFDSFNAGEDFEPWDAGLVIIDLAARIVSTESSYSAPQAQGEVQYHDGTQATEVSLPYRVPDDWLFVHSSRCGRLACDPGGEYLLHREKRRAERAANPPMDLREILYGPAMIEFIVLECASALGGSAELSGFARNASISQSAMVNPESVDWQSAIRNPQSIHARWLMTPRADLRGRTPREVILEKLDFIDFDLHTRELQWSLLNEGPPPLARDSHAYRFAGFGTHEYVIYYYLLRPLLGDCWARLATKEEIDVSLESARLESVKQAWLNERQDEFDGRIPVAIIESERRRMPMVMSGKQMTIDENCDVCRLMSGETGLDFGPSFWHLDGCNMDQEFEFSTYLTREEWEAEQRKWREFNEDFDRNWAKENRGKVGG